MVEEKKEEKKKPVIFEDSWESIEKHEKLAGLDKYKKKLEGKE
jgi:hypothetical protein